MVEMYDLSDSEPWTPPSFTDPGSVLCFCVFVSDTFVLQVHCDY